MPNSPIHYRLALPVLWCVVVSRDGAAAPAALAAAVLGAWLGWWRPSGETGGDGGLVMKPCVMVNPPARSNHQFENAPLSRLHIRAQHPPIQGPKLKWQPEPKVKAPHHQPAHHPRACPQPVGPSLCSPAPTPHATSSAHPPNLCVLTLSSSGLRGSWASSPTRTAGPAAGCVSDQ